MVESPLNEDPHCNWPGSFHNKAYPGKENNSPFVYVVSGWQNFKGYVQVLPSPINTYMQLAFQIPQQALHVTNFSLALLWPAAPHGCARKGGQRGGSAVCAYRARNRRA